MGARGRKPAAEKLTVVEGGFGQGRPPPPGDLSEAEAAIWREVVATEAPDFFATAALRGLLADYCRHRAAADSVSSIITEFQRDWLKSEEGSKRYHALLRMRELETRAGAAMARALRLTNQSRYGPRAADTLARHAVKGLRPWEA